MIDAKSYLRRIELYDAIINSKLEECSRLRNMLTKVTPTLSVDPGTGSHSDDKFCETMAKILDLEMEINREIDHYIDLKKDAFAVVAMLDNTDQYNVICKRYFDYKTFETIACEMNMTFRNVCYIHGKGLQEVDKILKERNISVDGQN